MIDAKEALSLGLVNHVVPSAELEQKTASLLTKMRELSSSSVGMTHTALELGTAGGNFESALERLENYYLHELMKTEDAHEGVRAFMEKRKPTWRNR
jgi:cyclohexa-1,5-dienecarbonyl-CoA hydratase